MAPSSNHNFFGYTPSLAGGAVFVAFFSLLILLHAAFTIKSRTYWGLFAILGGVSELIGWAARLMANKNDTSLNLYLAQIVTLILAPTFYSATCYITLGTLIRHLGAQHSRLRPYVYAIIFLTFDVIALVVQSVGGSKAAAAAKGQGGDVRLGGWISLAGVAFQLASMLIFAAVAIEYLIKVHRHSPNAFSSRPVRLIITGTAFASIMIIVRNTYRCVEMAQGFGGYLESHEAYFLVLDATLMVLAMGSLLVSHPAVTFSKMAPYQEDKEEMREVKAVKHHDTPMSAASSV